jgi:hypothetical protein
MIRQVEKQRVSTLRAPPIWQYLDLFSELQKIFRAFSAGSVLVQCWFSTSVHVS